MRHFLYLTDTRLVSLVTTRGRIVSRREFAVAGAGAAEFERYIVQMADAPIHLIVDLAEEDFRLDTVPHVGAGDRDTVLNRKLARSTAIPRTGTRSSRAARRKGARTIA
jgi:hypothetical protein